MKGTYLSRTNFASRRLLPVLLGIGTAVLLSFAACSDSSYDELQALTPQIPDDCLRHLVASDDATFTSYAREMGAGFWFEVSRRLTAAIDGSSQERFEYTRGLIAPPLGRVAAFIRDERGDGDSFPMAYLRWLESVPPGEAVARQKMSDARREVVTDKSMTSDAKAEWLVVQAAQWRERGVLNEEAVSLWRAASQYGAAGERRRQIDLLLDAARVFRRTESYRSFCQLLGELGSAYEDAGRVDSMFVAFEEGKRVADRYQLPNQAARMRLLEALYYRRVGRLSLAHDLFNEAQLVCREFGGGHYEIRYVYEAMRFYAELSAWETVKRLVDRSRALLGGVNVQLLATQELHRVRVARMEGRYLMAMERTAEASALFEDHQRQASELPWRWEYALYLLHWARGLVDNDMPERALPLIAEGVEVTAEMASTVYPAMFAVLQARAHSDMGDGAAALQAVAAFDAAALDDPQRLRSAWVERDVIVVRTAMADGDNALARDALAHAVDRLRSLLAGMDASAHGYLWLAECDELRELMHELSGGDAATGYGIEQYWRESAVLMGSGSGGGSAASADALFAEIRANAAALQRRLGEDDLHLVYASVAGETVRWTCRFDGLRAERIAPADEGLATDVSEAWTAMATDPGDADARPPAELVASLTSLAGTLLPPEIRDGRWRVNRVLVSASGPLARLPFETLNLGSEGDYVPLIEASDVAYLRRAGSGVFEAAASPGVVLTNASVSPSLRRRHPFQPEIVNVEAEGRAVVAQHPDAVLLDGAKASKSNLTSRWQDAGFVYIATHILRDPEAPYHALIPLAEPADALDPTAAYLDIADIRDANFRRCGAVVLSGCSSGAPYVGARVVGPSIGDAFVDAGADVVIGTFWDVRDDAAAELMASFVGEASLGGANVVEPLAATRRDLIDGPKGVRHPYHWAAYSVSLGSL